MTQTSAQAETFGGLFCRRFNCPPERYREAVFWHCVAPWRRPLAAAVMLVQRSVFEFDFELIDAVAQTCDLREFNNEILLCVMGMREWSLLRDGFKIRLSRYRLGRLGNALLPRDRSKP